MQSATLRGFTILAVLTVAASTAFANSPRSSAVWLRPSVPTSSWRSLRSHGCEGDVSFVSVRASSDAGATWA
jgi:hypothetical protein